MRMSKPFPPRPLPLLTLLKLQHQSPHRRRYNTLICASLLFDTKMKVKLWPVRGREMDLILILLNYKMSCQFLYRQ